MKIEVSRKFHKQVEAINDQQLKSRVLAVIEAVINAEDMIAFHNLKKLSGFKGCYRIRLGDYRIVVFVENQKVIFAAFDHRSEIYKYFP